MILPIYTKGNNILHQKAELIGEIDQSILDLVNNMYDTMLSAKGIGLAAPQVGQSKALVILEMSENNIEDIDPNDIIPFTVLINPRITWKSPICDKSKEGCLSVPGEEGLVKRSVKIRVKAKNLEGQEVELKTEGFFARLIQHEIDHINGIIFTDKMIGKLEKVPLIDYPRI